jgi:hypothetical protein
VIRYNALLERKLTELRTDVHTFFRIAHTYMFGTCPDLMCDVDLYNREKVIPVYVTKYLNQQEPSCK